MTITFLLKILFVAMIISGVIVLTINYLLFNKIKKEEPNYFENNFAHQSNYFESSRHNFPWALLFGKFKQLKNKQSRFFCRLSQILFAIDLLFCVIFIGLMLYPILFH